VFPPVQPGSYNIKPTIPKGSYVQKYSSGEIPVGIKSSKTTDVPIELAPMTGSIEGAVYKNGSIKTPVPNVVVTAIDEKGNNMQATTDNNGKYVISSMPPGPYTIKPTIPEGFYVKEYSSGEIPVVVQSSKTTDVPIELVPMTGSIEGVVYKNDSNKTPVPNVVVSAVDEKGNNMQATTDNNGKYVISSMPPGPYTIKPSVPNGFYLTSYTTGEIPATVEFSKATFIPIELSAMTGQIQVFTFNDANANKVQDKNEAALTNVILKLQNSKGDIVKTINGSPDESGYSNFQNIFAGNYVVTATLQGYVVTTYASSNIPVTVAYDESVVLIVGMKPTTGTVFVTVCSDINGDGICDGTNTLPVQNITVFLYPEGSDTPVTSGPTNTSGVATFEIPPGNYYAKVPKAELPASSTFSAPATEGATQIITVAPEAFSTLQIPLVSNFAIIEGYLWVDFDKDGVKDSAKSGMVDCPVTIKSLSGTVVTSTVTNSLGFYSISVITGFYQVIFTNPAPSIYVFSGNVTAPDNQADESGVVGNLYASPEQVNEASASLNVKPGIKCAPKTSNDLIGLNKNQTYGVENDCELVDSNQN
jgi:hypothetical protein